MRCTCKACEKEREWLKVELMTKACCSDAQSEAILDSGNERRASRRHDGTIDPLPGPDLVMQKTPRRRAIRKLR